jgi:hypothetical protein
MNMNFGKLLSVGKSWVGGNGIGRYQMRDGLCLPKFISPRNPFRPEPVVEAVAPRPVAMISTPEVPESPVVSEVADLASVEKISLLVRVGNGLERAVLFCLDHNPFSAIGKPTLPRMPRFGKPAVQGELSLDKVKVVRSDLAHADLEVVRLGAGPK